MIRSEAGRATPFVDGIGVQLWLMRNTLADLRAELGLREVAVLSQLPDPLGPLVPVIKLQRTGGASDSPRFYTQFWMNYQVWSDEEPSMGWDARQAAFELANQVSRVLFLAKENQIVTPHGSIAQWRESSGFRKFDDPELPQVSRQVATYDLLIRNPSTPRT